MFMDTRNPPTDIAGFNPESNTGMCEYEPETAEKAVQFFPRVLKFVKGLKANEPFRLEPWQQDIIRTIFGWKREDGSRRFRQVFITVPRKNGKSTLIAGLSIFVLFCDAEAGAECYCAATGKEQASLVFDTAASMIRKSSLYKRCKVRDSRKRVIYGDSFLRAIPANEGVSHGFDSHFIVGDELHAWPGREFYDVLHTSTGARAQPLELYITTAGYDRNSICYETYQYAKQVRDGKIDDPTFLPVIYEAEEEEDWQSPKIWRKANPNLGVSVSVDYIARECEKAKRSPAYENTFRRLHLNQWTSQDSRWLPMDKWRKCKTTSGGIEEGATVWAGLDLSSTTDITAWALLENLQGGYRSQVHYFIPGDRVKEAEDRDRVPYRQWEAAGYVTIIPGAEINLNYVHQRMSEDIERYDIVAIGYDPWGARDTRQRFEENEGQVMVKVRQGYASLSEPCKLLEASVLSGTLDHGNDPVLDWMADNVEVRTDENGNIRPVKPEHKGTTRRIDGLIAILNAIHALGCEVPRPPATGRVAFV